MTFEREDRYIIIKRKDILNYLDDEQREWLSDICNTINWQRSFIQPLEYVVVERDWPEYEVVWKMIEERCKND